MFTEPSMNSIYLKILLIPISFAVHEFEEWNILKWYKKHYKDIPESTNASIRIWVVLISVIIFAMTLLALALINYTFLFSPLLVLISAFISVNVIQHIIWTIQYKDYSIGLSTALITLCVLIYVHFNVMMLGLVNAWFYLIMIYAIVPILKTIQSPHIMTREIRGVHELGIALERLIFKKSMIR